MRRRAPRPVGGANAALAQSLSPQTLLAQVQRLWPGVVGDTIAAEATPTASQSASHAVTWPSSRSSDSNRSTPSRSQYCAGAWTSRR